MELQELQGLRELLALVDARWHAAFIRFVQEGEAEDGFSEYLESDANCKKAVERAFDAQVQALEHLGAVLAGEPVEEAESSLLTQAKATLGFLEAKAVLGRLRPEERAELAKELELI